MKRGAEKPDYARIKELEAEMGIAPLPSVVVDGSDPGPVKVYSEAEYFRRLMVYVPPKVEELPPMPDQYQVYLITDCTKNPRWWE